MYRKKTIPILMALIVTFSLVFSHLSIDNSYISYLSINNSYAETLYSSGYYTATVDTFYKKSNSSSSTTLGKCKKGTVVYIEKIKRNSSGNHWGYVSTAKGYVYLGHFKLNSSPMSGYYTASIDTVYKKSNSSSSTTLGKCKKGTVVYIEKIKRNSSGNHWGYVGSGRYVFLGHFKLNSSPKSGYYTAIIDTVYKSGMGGSYKTLGTCKKGTTVYIEKIKRNSGGNHWGYVPAAKGYVFLGKFKLNSSPMSGYYQASIDTVYKSGRASSYKTLGTCKKGTTVYIGEIKRNSSGNHWGKVAGKGYVFLGHFKVLK